MWDLPGPGLEPVSSALAGRFLTTVPPGKSPLSVLLFNMILEVLDSAIRQEKEVECIQIGKEEVKPDLLSNNIIVCVAKPKDSTKMLL